MTHVRRFPSTVPSRTRVIALSVIAVVLTAMAIAPIAGARPDTAPVQASVPADCTAEEALADPDVVSCQRGPFAKVVVSNRPHAPITGGTVRHSGAPLP